jgi:hypothetical protein
MEKEPGNNFDWDDSFWWRHFKPQPAISEGNTDIYEPDQFFDVLPSLETFLEEMSEYLLVTVIPPRESFQGLIVPARKHRSVNEFIFRSLDNDNVVYAVLGAAGVGKTYFTNEILLPFLDQIKKFFKKNLNKNIVVKNTMWDAAEEEVKELIGITLKAFQGEPYPEEIKLQKLPNENLPFPNDLVELIKLLELKKALPLKGNETFEQKIQILAENVPTIHGLSYADEFLEYARNRISGNVFNMRKTEADKAVTVIDLLVAYGVLVGIDQNNPFGLWFEEKKYGDTVIVDQTIINNSDNAHMAIIELLPGPFLSVLNACRHLLLICQQVALYAESIGSQELENLALITANDITNLFGQKSIPDSEFLKRVIQGATLEQLESATEAKFKMLAQMDGWNRLQVESEIRQMMDMDVSQNLNFIKSKEAIPGEGIIDIQKLFTDIMTDNKFATQEMRTVTEDEHSKNLPLEEKIRLAQDRKQVPDKSTRQYSKEEFYTQLIIETIEACKLLGITKETDIKKQIANVGRNLASSQFTHGMVDTIREYLIKNASTQEEKLAAYNKIGLITLLNNPDFSQSYEENDLDNLIELMWERFSPLLAPGVTKPPRKAPVMEKILRTKHFMFAQDKAA